MRLRLLILALLGLLPLAVLHAADNLIEAKAAVQREILSGFTRAYSRLVLSAEQAGRVVKVSADVGDTIKAGEPFACLDDTYLDLELRANRAERDALRVDETYFEKEVVRYSRLVKQNSSSQSQLDTAQRNQDKTRTQIEALTVAAEILQERKARLCIDAPAGWLVIKRYVEPGKWVNAGEPVVEVGDYSHLVAPFALSVAEYRALREQLDKGLKVKLPELKAELPANIIRVSPAFDEQSRKIHLELELSKGLPAHRGGIRVDLALEVPTRTGAVLIPERALQQRYEQYWLKRPDGNEIAVVYLGRSHGSDGAWVRVVSPEIKPGDRFQVIDK
jgi:RND family efflux transporter MFP subunit